MWCPGTTGISVPVPARDPQPAKPAGRGPQQQVSRTRAGPRAQVLALQRAAGNRAVGRVLSRWIRHPDPEQKGVMVPDSTAEEFTHFNPPKNE
jgi:hypothetical protein